jgi:hypothetical protein
MAINFTDGSDYVVFHFSGNTYIGRFHTSVPSQVTATGGTHDSLTYDENCYYVENPAKVDADLTIPASGSAELNWKITPVLFRDLVNTSADTNYNSIVFTYPKSQVAISNIGGDIIDATLLSAYKELCE